MISLRLPNHTFIYFYFQPDDDDDDDSRAVATPGRVKD